ncbi:MAG: hypothetical protein WDN72_00615 [Alphaproteobacteria bacterium]
MAASGPTRISAPATTTGDGENLYRPLLHCDPVLCQDAAYVFNYITGYARPEKFKKLASPR